MLVLALPQRDCVRDLPLYIGMLRLRGRAFDRSGDESLFIAGEFEVDRFDALGPTYFLAVDDERQVVGSIRALPTTGPTMLSEATPDLLGQIRMPTGPSVYEVSRLCVDPDRAPEMGPHGVRCTTSALLAGVIEWGLLSQVEAVLATTGLATERMLARAGWPLERLAEPHETNGERVVAGWLPVNAEALSHVREAGDFDAPVLAM